MDTAPYLSRPTTRQSDVFPLWRKDDESWEASQDRISRQRFAIEDDLLYACITYGDGLPANFATQGFTVSKGLGYALLLFFARQALGLYRYPYCEDRILSSDSSVRFNKQTQTEFCRTIAELTPQRVGKICDELRRLYDHTQNQLSNAGLTSVTLTRRVYDQSSPYREQRRYAQLLYGLKRAADLVDATTVQFEMDSINSFGDDGGYGHFPVTLRLDVPAEGRHSLLQQPGGLAARQWPRGGTRGMGCAEPIREWSRFPAYHMDRGRSGLLQRSLVDGRRCRATFLREVQPVGAQSEPQSVFRSRSMVFRPMLGTNAASTPDRGLARLPPRIANLILTPWPAVAIAT